jgi:hypothetical protein
VVLQVILFFLGVFSRTYLGSLEKRCIEISPKNKEADLLKGQVEVINQKVSVIDELMVDRFSWSKKLGDLSDCVTSGIWLTEVSCNDKVSEKSAARGARAANVGEETLERLKPVAEKSISRYLVISGYASSKGEEGTALIGKFIKSLKDNRDFYSDFSDIELGGIRRDKTEDQEVMGFRITCLFKERQR